MLFRDIGDRLETNGDRARQVAIAFGQGEARKIGPDAGRLHGCRGVEGFRRPASTVEVAGGDQRPRSPTRSVIGAEAVGKRKDFGGERRLPRVEKRPSGRGEAVGSRGIARAGAGARPCPAQSVTGALHLASQGVGERKQSFERRRLRPRGGRFRKSDQRARRRLRREEFCGEQAFHEVVSNSRLFEVGERPHGTLVETEGERKLRRRQARIVAGAEICCAREGRQGIVRAPEFAQRPSEFEHGLQIFPGAGSVRKRIRGCVQVDPGIAPRGAQLEQGEADRCVPRVRPVFLQRKQRADHVCGQAVERPIKCRQPVVRIGAGRDQTPVDRHRLCLEAAVGVGIREWPGEIEARTAKGLRIALAGGDQRIWISCPFGFFERPFAMRFGEQTLQVRRRLPADEIVSQAREQRIGPVEVTGIESFVDRAQIRLQRLRCLRPGCGCETPAGRAQPDEIQGQSERALHVLNHRRPVGADAAEAPRQ